MTDENPVFRYALFEDREDARAYSRAIYAARSQTVPGYLPSTEYYSAVEHEPAGNANATGTAWYVPLPDCGCVALPPEAELVAELPEDW
jgi:hypothetical protein